MDWLTRTSRNSTNKWSQPRKATVPPSCSLDESSWNVFDPIGPVTSRCSSDSRARPVVRRTDRAAPRRSGSQFVVDSRSSHFDNWTHRRSCASSSARRTADWGHCSVGRSAAGWWSGSGSRPSCRSRSRRPKRTFDGDAVDCCWRAGRWAGLASRWNRPP